MTPPDFDPPPAISPAQHFAAINAERARHRRHIALLGAIIAALALVLAACAPAAPRVGDQGGQTDAGARSVTVGPDGPGASFWDGRMY